MIARLRSRGAMAILTVGFGLAALGGIARWSIAADHRDSPLVTEDPAADIADVYSFLSPADPNKLVLVMTVHGLTPPGETAQARFDPQAVYQFKIDTNQDALEDLIVAAHVSGPRERQTMNFRGLSRTPGGDFDLDPRTFRVPVSGVGAPIVGRFGDVSLFAGPRDDPFFFDLVQFRKIVAGEASSFNNPGTDTFAGTNVLAIAIEFPISLLGPNTSRIGVWGATGRIS